MNTTSTGRILFVGATFVTLIAGVSATAAMSGIVTQICNWQNSAASSPLDRWSQISEYSVIILIMTVLTAAVWGRIIRRRIVLKNMSEELPTRFTQRSKYAVWKRVGRTSGRPVGTKSRAPKRIQR
ncbi:MAG: hypothetical protein ACRYFS_21360 [Janthinobacterium lividum]